MSSGDDPPAPSSARCSPFDAPPPPYNHDFPPSSPFPESDVQEVSPSIANSLKNLVRTPAEVSLQFPAPSIASTGEGVERDARLHRKELEDALVDTKFGYGTAGRPQLLQLTEEEQQRFQKRMEEMCLDGPAYRSSGNNSAGEAEGSDNNESRPSQKERTLLLERQLSGLHIFADGNADKGGTTSEAASSGPPPNTGRNNPSQEISRHYSPVVHYDRQGIRMDYVPPIYRFRANELASPGRASPLSVNASPIAPSSRKKQIQDHQTSPVRISRNTGLEKDRLREEDDSDGDKDTGAEEWQTRPLNRMREAAGVDKMIHGDLMATPVTKHTQNYSVSIPRHNRPVKQVTPTTASVIPDDPFQVDPRRLSFSPCGGAQYCERNHKHQAIISPPVVPQVWLSQAPSPGLSGYNPFNTSTDPRQTRDTPQPITPKNWTMRAIPPSPAIVQTPGLVGKRTVLPTPNIHRQQALVHHQSRSDSKAPTNSDHDSTESFSSTKTQYAGQGYAGRRRKGVDSSEDEFNVHSVFFPQKKKKANANGVAVSSRLMVPTQSSRARSKVRTERDNKLLNNPGVFNTGPVAQTHTRRVPDLGGKAQDFTHNARGISRARPPWEGIAVVPAEFVGAAVDILEKSHRAEHDHQGRKQGFSRQVGVEGPRRFPASMGFHAVPTNTMRQPVQHSYGSTAFSGGMYQDPSLTGRRHGLHPSPEKPLRRNKSRARFGEPLEDRIPGGYISKLGTQATHRQAPVDTRPAPVQTSGRRHTPPNRLFTAVSTHNLNVFDRLCAPTAASRARARSQRSGSRPDSRNGASYDPCFTAHGHRSAHPVAPGSARREPPIYAPDPRTPQTQLEAWEQRGYAAYEAARLIEKSSFTMEQKHGIQHLHRLINAVFVGMKLRAPEKEAKIETAFGEVVAQLNLLFFLLEGKPDEAHVAKMIARVAARGN